MKAVVDILKTKLINRKVPVKNLVFGKMEEASGGTLRQSVQIQQGIVTEKAKQIVKDIKGMNLKVQAQINENQIRVSGKEKDDLQAVIQALKGNNYEVELQFTNYR
jgi:uncharacterized protein YajQ (UPF0234 family)